MRTVSADGPVPLGIALRRRFRASPEALFRAWTEPAVLRDWWCPPGWVAHAIAVDLRVGGSYRIEMVPAAGGELVAVTGEFFEVEPPRLLVFSWRWESDFSDTAPTLVTLQLDAAGDETLLTLRHDNFALPGPRQQHRTGWLAACNRLDRLVTPAIGR